FERDPGASVETWRSPDGSLQLTHTTSWVLGFLDGEIDLGPDLRSGDLGLRIEGIAPPRPPTVLDGVSLDRVIVGPNRGAAILAGEYGHDELYPEAPLAVEAALLVANAAPRAGWGFWLSGGPGDDIAIATAAADIVLGGGGSDTLLGGPGDDLVDGDADEAPILNGYHFLWDYRPDPAESY